MAIDWFLKSAGSNIAPSLDDPTLLCIGVDFPDYAMAPPETGHPGIYRCLGVRQDKCPLPGHDHLAIHYILDGPVHCAECVESYQFAWYKPRESK